MTQDWRIETTARTYFDQQQRQADIESRRPTIRQASDLVGPGIGATATRITDYNDLLATFNGYYSSAPGAANAPNSTEAFIGQVVSDAELGGRQVFTSLGTDVTYSRSFVRNIYDPESIEWGPWTGQRIPPSVFGYVVASTTVPHNTATTLAPPSIPGVGDASAYTRTPSGIQINKQGVYTGVIRVGSNSAVTANVTTQRPDGESTLSITYGSQLLGPSIQIPFTVRATDALQGFSVSVLQNSGASAVCWWQFQCTRVGDAV